MEILKLREKYKLSPDLIITYSNGKPIINIPSMHKKIDIDWKVLKIISFFSDSDYPIEILEKNFSDELLNKIIETLINSDILITNQKYKNSKTAKMVEEWEEWGEPTWFMQLQSQDAPYISVDDMDKDSINLEEAPESYTCKCKDNSIYLPSPENLNQNFSDVLTSRRTCRNFSGENISLQSLSNLLFYTGAILFTNSTNYFGEVNKKVAPSPGSRHSIELYPVINNCHGVEEGIYHYCQKHHSLTLISDTSANDFLDEALYGQEYFLDAAVTIFYTSVVNRLKWKYKGSRIYRIMHYETAHYAQNFLLTGTALNLGVFVTGAIKDSVIETKLKIDGVNEVPLYVSGVGQKTSEGPYSRAGIKVGENVSDEMNIKFPKMLSSTDEQKILG